MSQNNTQQTQVDGISICEATHKTQKPQFPVTDKELPPKQFIPPKDFGRLEQSIRPGDVGFRSKKYMRANMDNRTAFVDGKVEGHTFNGSQAKRIGAYFGCKTNRCPHIGTVQCVHIQKSGYDTDVPCQMVEKGSWHSNGICKGRMAEIITYFELMDKPNGQRLVRNKNILRVQDYTDSLYDRLLDVKRSGPLSEEEKGLLYAYHQMSMELNRRLESALKQDEGTKVEVTKLTPSQINDLIKDAKEKRKQLEQKESALLGGDKNEGD